MYAFRHGGVPTVRTLDAHLPAVYTFRHARVPTVHTRGNATARRVHSSSQTGPHRAHKRPVSVHGAGSPVQESAHGGGVVCRVRFPSLPGPYRVHSRHGLQLSLPPCTLSGTGELPRVHKLPGSVYGRDADASATVNPSTRPVSLRSRKRLGPEACGQGGGARPRVGKRQLALAPRRAPARPRAGRRGFTLAPRREPARQKPS